MLRELSTDEATTALSRAFELKMKEIRYLEQSGYDPRASDEPLSKDERVNGKIKKLPPDKKFGFITGEDGVDRFFHSDECLVAFDALTEGKKVKFTATDGKKGPRAVDVNIEA